MVNNFANKTSWISNTFTKSTEPAGTVETMQTSMTKHTPIGRNTNMIHSQEAQEHVHDTYAFQPVVHDG